MLASSPDLTGTNPAYAVAGDPYTIFKNPQLIRFDAPVYIDSLVVMVGNVILTQGQDWTVAETDDTATSRALNLNSGFSHTLIRSINIVSSSHTVPYQVACSYQQFYLNTANVNAMTATAPKLLPLDPNETNAGNVVTESYPVNTFSNQNLILPACGSFFADSVVITLPTNPVTTLVAGVDYLIIACDVPKTRCTSNKSGVYNGILLTRQYAGTVTVTYHAYGGIATLGDMISLNQSLDNIIEYLSSNPFLTPGNLGNNPVILSIINRLSVFQLALSTVTSSGGSDDAAMTTYILGLLGTFMNSAPTDPSTLSAEAPWNNGGNLAFVPS